MQGARKASKSLCGMSQVGLPTVICTLWRLDRGWDGREHMVCPSAFMPDQGRLRQHRGFPHERGAQILGGGGGFGHAVGTVACVGVEIGQHG